MGLETRNCAVCGRSLGEAEAAGEMSTTLSASHSGKRTYICSTKCWDTAIKRLERRNRRER